MRFFQRWKKSFVEWCFRVPGKRQPRSSAPEKKLRVPKLFTLGFYAGLLAMPFKWLKQKWRRRRIQDLLWGVPSLLGIVVALVFLLAAAEQERTLSISYYDEARAALQRQDFSRAQLYLARVLKRGDVGVSDAQYSMAVLFEELGQKDRAAELFSVLAPQDRVGNPKAHRRMAVLLSESLSAKSTAADLKDLRWHLDASQDETSAPMAMAWGRYSLATGDIKSAKERLESAAQQFPELWQALGAIETRRGNASSAVGFYERASSHLSGKLRGDPTDDDARVNYATVLMKLGQLDGARVVLEQGLEVNSDGPWQAMLASLAVNYHDLKASQGAALSELFGYLERALTHDPDHAPALSRLMGYATADVKGNAELRTVLARVVAEGEQPALAHLAMGNLCWLEGRRDQANFHFERALSLRDNMAPLLNNMAWLVAHDEQSPDFERAMALVNSALEKWPKHASFLDTRGTIHLLRGSWKEALTDLEKALSGVNDKSAVHKKLATIYDRLEMPEIAEQHRNLALK